MGSTQSNDNTLRQHTFCTNTASKRDALRSTAVSKASQSPPFHRVATTTTMSEQAACTTAVSYTLTLDAPITLDVPSDVVLGSTLKLRTLDEIKSWLWENEASRILSSLRVEAVNSSSSSAASNNGTAGKAVPQDEEEKDDRVHKKRRINDEDDGKQQQQQQQQQSREHLLDTIARVQRQFFQSVSPREVFGGLLEGLLDLMSSEYGFIGEVKYEEQDQDDGGERRMYLQTHAITNIAWNQATRQFYEDNIESGTYAKSYMKKKSEGDVSKRQAPHISRYSALTSLPLSGLKFYNLNTLFGKVMMTQRPVISNNPSTDPRAGGVPEGHPPLNHFLGLPFFHSGKLTGMVGISNKPGGYTEADIDFLEPLTVTCSNLIQAYQQIRRNEYLINTLEESVKARTQELEDANKNLEEANRQVRRTAVMQMQHFACMSHEIRTPLNCIIGTRRLGSRLWSFSRCTLFDSH